MTNINQSAAFDILCKNLGQGLDVTTAEELVQHALIGLDAAQVGEVKIFLDNDLLASGYTEEELRKWWWATPSTLTFADGKGLVAFLELLRRAIDKPPYAE